MRTASTQRSDLEWAGFPSHMRSEPAQSISAAAASPISATRRDLEVGRIGREYGGKIGPPHARAQGGPVSSPRLDFTPLVKQSRGPGEKTGPSRKVRTPQGRV